MVMPLEPATNASGDSEATPSDRKGGGDREHHGFITKRLWPGALCCALYVLLAVATYGLGSLGPGQIAGKPIDSIEEIWWLAWAAHALPQVHDLFLAKGQNYPYGQNFGVNGSMLALGVLFAPITKLFGPVVTFNVLLRLAVVASASSMCFVLRRWINWWPAAFLGGLLYGFSAYTSNYGAYVFLIFVPLPPLILLLLHEIFVRQQWRPGRTGIALGLLCALQFFIWVEVLAGTVVIGFLAVAVILVVARCSLAQRWRYAATALAYSLVVVCALLAYPLAFTFAGPEHISGPPESTSFLAALNGDLVSPLIPSWGQWLDPIAYVGPPLNAGDLLYLGLPLVVVLAGFAVFLRRRKEILFAGAMALIAFAFSLGSPLTIDGHKTSVPLPFVLLAHLPALSGFEARRFALYTDLFVAAMFAIGIDELWKRMRQRPHLLGLSRGWSKALGVSALGTLVLAVTLPLVPSSAQSTLPTDVPDFFTSTAVDSIPPGSVVLAYPYPDGLTNTVLLTGFPIRSLLLYQAVTGMRFDLIGGYGWFPSPTGHGGSSNPAPLEPQSVQALFDSGYVGVTPQERALLEKSDLTTDLRNYLRKYDVQTVLVVEPPVSTGLYRGFHPDTATVISHVTAAIGPPVETGGVTVWFDVRQRLAAVTR